MAWCRASEAPAAVALQKVASSTSASSSFAHVGLVGRVRVEAGAPGVRVREADALGAGQRRQRVVAGQAHHLAFVPHRDVAGELHQVRGLWRAPVRCRAGRDEELAGVQAVGEVVPRAKLQPVRPFRGEQRAARALDLLARRGVGQGGKLRASRQPFACFCVAAGFTYQPSCTARGGR
jgi:hypothetical protein